MNEPSMCNGSYRYLWKAQFRVTRIGSLRDSQPSTEDGDVYVMTQAQDLIELERTLRASVEASSIVTLNTAQYLGRVYQQPVKP